MEATLLVARAQAAMVRGDWEEASAFVDFEAKSGRLLGETYAQGAPDEKARLHAILREQLRQTWERTWQPRVLEPAEIATQQVDGATVVTLSLPANEMSEPVEMTWTVADAGSGLRIVDREVSLGGRGSTTRAFIHLVMSKARERAGGEPTLTDAIDEIEASIGTTMIRRIEITEP